MKRIAAYALVLGAILLFGGCSRKADGPISMGARTESMPQQGDEPMEEMPDDDQGVIHF